MPTHHDTLGPIAQNKSKYWTNEEYASRPRPGIAFYEREYGRSDELLRDADTCIAKNSLTGRSELINRVLPVELL